MNAPHYIGFDVHKKTISFCVKTAAGEVVEEGNLPAQRGALRQWALARPQPWQPSKSTVPTASTIVVSTEHCERLGRYDPAAKPQ